MPRSFICFRSAVAAATASHQHSPAAARGRPPGAMTSISVGIIGAGANTKLHHIPKLQAVATVCNRSAESTAKVAHIPKLQAIAGVTVATVCNRSAESTAKVAQEFGIRWASLSTYYW
jgi:predicted dehydrogenase